jgi:hypothetical protein
MAYCSFMVTNVRATTLLLTVAALVAVALSLPPMPQPISYHDFADKRGIAGIPNALNVLSNLPFAVVGTLGLSTALYRSTRTAMFSHAWERWPYVALFAGVLLTAFGSSFYHMDPNNTSLLWDRLPITVGFMGLLTAIVGERVSIRLARRLLIPLLLLGVASVHWWYLGELRGQGDLRPYALVQYGSLLIIVLLIALLRSRYADTRYVVAALVGYGAAMALDLADRAVFSLGGIVSGHTLKHILASGGVACLVAMLRARAKARG